MTTRPDKTFHIVTLGCKINQYESQSLREAWAAMGSVETRDPTRADTILVNSCAVTAHAVSDLRQAVRRMHRDNPDAAIVVTGCAAQVLGQELAGLPGVAEVVPQERKTRLLGGIGNDRRAAQDFAISDYERSRAVVKVQDGCSHRCTYCIVPLARGASQSRAPGEVLAEIRRLLDAGFREIVLSGINLRQYGPAWPGPGFPTGDAGNTQDTGTADFWALCALLEKELAPEWADRARLRISSVDPGQFTGAGFDRALGVLTDGKMFCPHLHLSIQSGSPSVLRRMGRGHYGPGDILDFVTELARCAPLLGLGADILTAFPGETDEHHAETVALVRGLGLTYAHVFPYSARPGTPAARLGGQLPKQIKKQRSAELRALVADKKTAFIERVLAEADTVRVALQHIENITHKTEVQQVGVSEHYVACRFTTLPPESDRELAPARPVGTDNGVLLVEPTS